MTSNLKLPGPKMIFIPGGTYMMGERGDVVTVGDFWMDETPVTVAQYREAVNAGACTPPAEKNHEFFSNYIEGREDHPVNCVDWYQACTYADWAGKRLPTEEEWEWAARGGDEDRLYPWGGERRFAPLPSDQLCWNGPGNDLGEGNRKSTSPVGSYPKGNSRHGLKDMVGNVWEWTSSTYSSTSEHKVVRGGSWFTSRYNFIHVSNRDFFSFAHINSFNVGFRCVL